MNTVLIVPRLYPSQTVFGQVTFYDGFRNLLSEQWAWVQNPAGQIELVCTSDITIFPHEPRSRYEQGCRCEECCAYSRGKKQRIRDTHRAERVHGIDGRPVHPRAPHGTIGGYDNWICRCPDCTSCAAEKTANHRERAKR